MKRIFLFIIIFSLCSSGFAFSAFALDAAYQNTFKEANDLYLKGDYEAAAKKYRKLSLLEPTAESFYNLGDAYYKTKKLGRAIAAYEKASLISPRDQDIRKNLRFLKTLIQSKIPDTRPWIFREIEKYVSFITFLEWQIIILGIISVSLLWMIVLLIFGRNPFRSWVLQGLIILFIMAGLGAGLRYYFSVYYKYGIVIRQDSEARYGASKDEKVVFRLPEGLKIRILEERGSWLRIQLTNKDTGWILKDDLELIKIA